MINMENNQPKRFLPLEEALVQLERSLALALVRVPFSLQPYTKYLSGALGKNLRGKSLLVAASDDQQTVDEDAITLAVSIELFHLATLVHDDIIDDAALRRGQASLQSQFGKKMAVLCGDYLLSLATEMGAKVRRDHDTDLESYSLSFYGRSVCLGEIRQGANNYNFDLSLYRYLTIIRGKTAMLFEAAFAGGAWILEDKKGYESYRKIGRYMGMLFQMMDDLIDLEQSELQAKKPILSDLSSGVITLPLIYAMEEDRELKALLLQQREEGFLDIPRIAQGIIAAKGAEKTRHMVERYEALAKKELAKLKLPPLKEECIVQLLDKAVGR